MTEAVDQWRSKLWMRNGVTLQFDHPGVEEAWEYARRNAEFYDVLAAGVFRNGRLVMGVGPITVICEGGVVIAEVPSPVQ